MSNTNTPFRKATVLTQKSSPFDMSHNNYSTVEVGKLYPMYVEKVMPGDKFSVGCNFRAQLPPLASNFLGHVDVRYNAFFVPDRLLYGAFQEYQLYSQGLSTGYIPQGMPKYYIPKLVLGEPATPATRGATTLADYLGDKTSSSQTDVDIMPFLAYHRVWRDWYRQPNIQRDPYNNAITSSTVPNVKNLHKSGITSASYVSVANANCTFEDGARIYDLRKVNYAKDYFTNAFPTQDGGAAPFRVQINGAATIFNLDSSGLEAGSGAVSVGGTYHDLNAAQGSNKWAITATDMPYRAGISFSIPQLRSANALQKFAENNSLAGGRYKDMILATYGVAPADALCDMPIYLGGFTTEIYKNQVNTTANASGTEVNPFTNKVGGSGANGFAMNSGSLFDNFNITEHGYIMVMVDVLPHANYGSGTNRHLLVVNNNIGGENFVDRYCVPALSSIGHQPILQCELNGAAGINNVFGYTDRYSEYKWHPDETHGLLQNGQSLSFMALQRNFTGNPTISSSFIEVNNTDMDNVTAVSAGLSTYGVVLDTGFSVKAIRPLPMYSIPTLCEEVDKKTTVINRGGKRL